jgi:hypothetical protein
MQHKINKLSLEKQQILEQIKMIDENFKHTQFELLAMLDVIH